MTLLAEIQAAALDSSVSLPDLLRKCKVLAARLKHAEFAAWVGHELNGYPDRASLPPYRVLRATESRGTFVGSFGRQAKNVPVPTLNLPDELRALVTDLYMTDSVGSMSALANSEQMLRLPWSADLIVHVGHNYPLYEDMTLVSAWRPMPPGIISGILDTVRTRILDFVLAIEAENANAGENTPDRPAVITPASVTHVYNTTIVGGQAIVGNSGDASIGSGNVARGQTAGGDITEPAQLLPMLEKLREEAAQAPIGEEERAEAIELVETMKKGAAMPQGKFSADKILKYLSVYSTLVTTASTTIPQLEHALKFLAHAAGL